MTVSPAAIPGIHRLDPLLRARSAVVVGASANPSFVSSILKNLLRCGFAGQVAAVNPRYQQVLEAPCYASVLDVPWPIDLVVVGVGWRAVPDLLTQCEQKQVGALVMITSGYAETGAEGAERQRQLTAWADRTGTPICGPNCLGLMHAASGLMALPSSLPRIVAGEIGLVLQSGMMAPSVLAPLFARDIGVTYAVTSGNEAVVDLADYIRYFVEDEQTRVIGCFAEQIKRPEAFIASCEAAADRGKPIVMLKIGRSDASRRSAMAHTGSLAGTDAVIDAALKKLGVTRVMGVDEMFETLAIFHTRRLPRGDGLAAISVSGGAAGLLSDLALDAGVRFTALPEPTLAELRTVVPEFGNVGNPLDVTGQGVFQTDLLSRSVDLLADAPGVDAILYARSFPAHMDAASPVFKTLQNSVERHPDVPLIAMCLAGGHLYPSAAADTPVQAPVDRLDGVPFLQGADYGLRAVASLMRYSAYLRARGSDAPRRRAPVEARDIAREVILGETGARLTALDGSTILAAYGIPTPREAFARSLDEALAHAARIGYPVALKVESPSLAHKARAGGVALDVRDPDALAAAYEQVTASADDVHGVLVQEMIADGQVEVILGMSRDPQFGPVIACGLGGVFVELLRDVQLLVPPVTEREVRAALQQLRASALLASTDVDALVDAVLRFSDLCTDVADLVQAIDLNPVVVRAAGRGLGAVDSLFERNPDGTARG